MSAWSCFVIGWSFGFVLAACLYGEWPKRWRRRPVPRSNKTQVEWERHMVVGTTANAVHQTQQLAVSSAAFVAPFTVICDYCKRHFANGELKFSTRDEADATVTADGWAVSHVNSKAIHGCPACLRRRAAL